jgi:hypothetical protein
MASTTFDIETTGTINGTQFTAHGEGSGDPTTGRVDFGATFDPAPEGATAFGALLSVLIIPTTGLGRPEEGARNLVDLAGQGFDFTQAVTGERVTLDATGSFRRHRDRDHFQWTADANGDVRLGAVSAVRPFHAVMVPGGPGRMTETLNIPLVLGDGRTQLVIVRTFTFDDAVQLPDLQLRHMSMDVEDRGARADVRIQADIVPFSRAWRTGRSGGWATET